MLMIIRQIDRTYIIWYPHYSIPHIGSYMWYFSHSFLHRIIPNMCRSLVPRWHVLTWREWSLDICQCYLILKPHRWHPNSLKLKWSIRPHEERSIYQIWRIHQRLIDSSTRYVVEHIENSAHALPTNKHYILYISPLQ